MHGQRRVTTARSPLAPLILLVLDGVLLIWTSIRHVLWRDEAQAWLIARDSPTLTSLIHNLRYEGHPPLWHLILYAITRVTHNPEWIKLPNLLAALSASALVLFSATLSLPTRCGIVFSYFFFFEYGVLNRNYMLGIALLVAAVLASTRRPASSPWLVSVLLSLAALSSLPALLLSICFFAVYLAERVGLPRPPRSTPTSPVPWSSLLPAILIFATSALLAVILIRPPADSGVFVGADHSATLRQAIWFFTNTIAEALLPIPIWNRHFWNVNFYSRLPAHSGTLVGFIVASASVVYFRTVNARALYIAATILIVAQTFISGRIAMRHLGWIFIAFILALFLDSAPQTAPRSWRKGLLAAILTAQVYATLFVVLAGTTLPFSSSRQAATFLRKQHLDHAPMAFEPDYISAPVLAYLDRPSAWSFERHRPASFTVWTMEETLGHHPPTPGEWSGMSGPNHGQAVLILDKPLTAAAAEALHLRQIASFVGAVVPLESYYIYR